MKSKQTFTLLLSFIMLLTLLPQIVFTAAANTASYSTWTEAGNAAAENIDYMVDSNGNYMVYTALGLAKISNLVEDNGDVFIGKTVSLANDIDLMDAGVSDYTKETVTISNSWKPIGSSTNSFQGIFEGGNHRIQNLFVAVNDAAAGLFGLNSGTIQNLELASGEITLYINAGSTSEYSAGMTGINVNIIRNCTNRADVKAITRTTTDANTVYIGGIAGLNNTSLNTDGAREINCVNYGSVTSICSDSNLTNIYGGGIAGYHYGGMIANKSTMIDDCRNFGTINLNGPLTARAGGIAGYAYTQASSGACSINSCFNSGTVTANATYCMTGGITGYSYTRSSIHNSYNTGNVSGNKNTGGIAGLSTINIENCYNIGIISGEGNLGGIVGKRSKGTISNCFYLDNISNAGSGVSSGCTVKTAAEFKDGSVAWLLNTANKNIGDDGYIHSGIWSQAEQSPVFADSTNKPVYKIQFIAGQNGTINPAGVSYLKGGDSFAGTITAENGFHICSILFNDLDMPVRSEISYPVTEDSEIKVSFVSDAWIEPNLSASPENAFIPSERNGESISFGSIQYSGYTIVKYGIVYSETDSADPQIGKEGCLELESKTFLNTKNQFGIEVIGELLKGKTYYTRPYVVYKGTDEVLRTTYGKVYTVTP